MAHRMKFSGRRKKHIGCGVTIRNIYHYISNLWEISGACVSHVHGEP